MPVSPGALASVAGRGQGNGTVSLGDRALTPGMSVYSRECPKEPSTSVSVAQSVSAFGC